MIIQLSTISYSFGQLLCAGVPLHIACGIGNGVLRTGWKSGEGFPLGVDTEEYVNG